MKFIISRFSYICKILQQIKLVISLRKFTCPFFMKQKNVEIYVSVYMYVYMREIESSHVYVTYNGRVLDIVTYYLCFWELNAWICWEESFPLLIVLLHLLAAVVAALRNHHLPFATDRIHIIAVQSSKTVHFPNLH